jgi:hypothetical protein
MPGQLKYVFAISVLISPFLSGNLRAQDINHHPCQQMKDSTMMKRQEMIHSRSHMVMPFDMNKVTHYFIKTNTGGILMIKAKDPTDTLQISMIRKHLHKEGILFSKADFKDPKTLHGMHMPGLKTLSESKGKFTVAYKQLPDGAKLTFASKDAVVIDALHVWFDAQLKDHGSDAKSKE